MQIILVRHTTVDVPAGMCYGQSDVPVADTFFSEADTVKANLSGIPFTRVFTSPLSRCQRLAEHCGFGDAVPDDRLMELDFGEWEMHRWEELDMSVWKTDWVRQPPPGGESFRHLYERVASFLDELAGNGNEKALIFTHGGVIRCARVYFGETTLEKSFDTPAAFGEMVLFTRCPEQV